MRAVLVYRFEGIEGTSTPLLAFLTLPGVPSTYVVCKEEGGSA